MKKLIFIIFLASFIYLISACDHSHEHEDEHSAEAEITAGSPDHGSEDDSTAYTLLTLKKQPFSFTLRTGGRIMVDSRDVIIVTAKSSGLVSMINDYLFPGVKITKGDVLFTVSGSQLAEGNTELQFRQVKADLAEASANYDRAKALISDKIITGEDFLATKNRYEKLLNEYENLSATSGSNGNIVAAPGAGYIKEIFVTEGQKVETGQQLASLVVEHNLVLRADVSPDDLRLLSSVESANFSVGYSKKLFRTTELNGRKISQGKSTDGSSYYIPVFFRIDYIPELIDGTFAEVYLIGKETDDAIVVPNTALMEEYGKIFVYVAHDDGDFIKRYIETGSTDGERTMVESGLAEGEKIVATGTYRIKLMQSASTAPSHAHKH